MGDKLEVMVLDIDEYTKKISLSMRTLTPQENKKRFSRRKVPRYGTKKDIGFDSLEERLPKWVEDAKRDERKANE